MADETLGDRLTKVMKVAGLKNPEVAEAAGVHSVTVSRWRTDAQVPEEAQLERVVALLARKGIFTNAARLRYGGNGDRGVDAFAVGRDGNVTAVQAKHVSEGEPLPRQFQIMAKEFEVEALKLGAEEAEMDYIRMALEGPEAARMFSVGYRSRQGVSDEKLRADYAALINALRTYVKMRVTARKEEKRRA